MLKASPRMARFTSFILLVTALIGINSEYSAAVIIVVGILISKHPEDSLRVNSSLISSVIFLEFRKSYAKLLYPEPAAF